MFDMRLSFHASLDEKPGMFLLSPGPFLPGYAWKEKGRMVGMASWILYVLRDRDGSLGLNIQEDEI